MRIVGGKFKGTRLNPPPLQDSSIRPSSDFFRESLFNILTHFKHRDPIENARVLDLFSGTGALGLEALSRGAEYCLFVDKSAQARNLIRKNLQKLELVDKADIAAYDATQLHLPPAKPFDLLFLDPPYRKNLAIPALESTAQKGWLTPGALCCLEEDVQAPLRIPKGFQEYTKRRYGKSQLFLLLWKP